MHAEELKSVPSLRPEQAIGLVRAARLYQDAVWLAESEPNLAWLMLVAAVETAANIWSHSAESPRDRLTESKPELVRYLDSLNIETLTDRVAKEFAHLLGASKKFREFLLNHLPEPPSKRPPLFAQVNWSRENLDAAFRTIYDHRSRALHDGMPFPAPMCLPSVKYEPSWEAPEEGQSGGGMSMAGGTWLAKDIPMRLHTFEYIAREALNRWWSAMAADAARGDGAAGV
jgi:hypothetical protein